VESCTDVLRERERIWCGLETISFTTVVKEDGIRRLGMYTVCLEANDRIDDENSAAVHNSSLNSHVAPHTDSLQTKSNFFAIKDWLSELQSTISGLSRLGRKGFFGKSTPCTQISFAEILILNV